MIESALESMPDLAGAHIVLSQIAFQEGEMEVAYESASLAEELVTAGDSIRVMAKMMKNVIRGPGWTKPSVRETPHYRVKTDLRAERARFYADRLEAIRPLYEEVLGARSSDECVAPVLIFDSREGYHSYTAFSAGGRHENTLGMFLPWCGQLILFEGIDEEETLHVLYHEGFHQFAHEVLVSPPIWFNEGMAEYVGGTRIENGRIAERGLVQSGRLRNLQSALRNGWSGFSFEAIMQESQQAFYANNAPFKYAQAWSMIHFFMEGGDDHLREVLGDYIDRLKDGDTTEVAFRETWGQEDLSKIQARWLQYVNSLVP